MGAIDSLTGTGAAQVASVSRRPDRPSGESAGEGSSQFLEALDSAVNQPSSAGTDASEGADADRAAEGWSGGQASAFWDLQSLSAVLSELDGKLVEEDGETAHAPDTPPADAMPLVVAQGFGLAVTAAEPAPPPEDTVTTRTPPSPQSGNVTPANALTQATTAASSGVMAKAASPAADQPGAQPAPDRGNEDAELPRDASDAPATDRAPRAKSNDGEARGAGDRPSTTGGKPATTDAAVSWSSTRPKADDESEPLKPSASSDVKVQVVRSETHVVPAGRLGPVQQLGSAVAAAAGEMRTAAAPPDLPEPQPKSLMVKTLELRLEPRDLGTVTVRMSLSGDAMNLVVKVEGHDLAGNLRRERDELARMLQSSGCVLDSLVVQAVEGDKSGGGRVSTSMSQGGQSAAADPGSRQSAQSQAGGGGAGNERGGSDQSRERPDRDSGAQVRAPSGAIYL